MPVVFFDDCEAEKREISVSGSCVSPDGNWTSSGGGEPDDGVVGEGEPGSGGEFMVVVSQELKIPPTQSGSTRLPLLMRPLEYKANIIANVPRYEWSE